MKNIKINLFDIIVGLLILGIVIILGAKIFMSGDKGKSSIDEAYKKVEYEIMVENVRNMTAEAFKVGDKIYEEKKDTFMGTIKAVNIEPYKNVEMRTNGTLVEVEKEEYYTVKLLVESTAVEKETGYYLDGVLDLKVNSEYKINTKLVNTTVKVSSLKVE